MTIECGYCLRRESEGKPDVFEGEINFRSIEGHFFLVPHAEKRKENSPDYLFKLKNPRSGDFDQVGNAWVKDMKAGGSFFSITVDHPALTQAPVYLAAFPDDTQPKDTPKGKSANFTLRWGRPKVGARSDDAAAAAASGVGSDAIPF